MAEQTEYMTVSFYDPETGMILGIRSGQKASLDMEELPYVAGGYQAAEKYVDISRKPPFVRDRPAMAALQDKRTITADGEDFMTLSGLPRPCRVLIDSTEYEVSDGTLEWGTLMPGEYKITVTAWPYHDWEGEVTAVAGDSSTD